MKKKLKEKEENRLACAVCVCMPTKILPFASLLSFTTRRHSIRAAFRCRDVVSSNFEMKIGNFRALKLETTENSCHKIIAFEFFYSASWKSCRVSCGGHTEQFSIGPHVPHKMLINFLIQNVASHTNDFCYLSLVCS